MLAAAGAAGAFCRHGLAGLVQNGFGARFPWGTLVVNLVGCFAAGAPFGLSESCWALNGEAHVIVLIGDSDRHHAKPLYEAIVEASASIIWPEPRSCEAISATATAASTRPRFCACLRTFRSW